MTDGRAGLVGSNDYHGPHEFNEPLKNIRLMAASVGRQVMICKPCHVNCPDPMVVQQAVGLRVIGFWERLKEIEEIAPTLLRRSAAIDHQLRPGHIGRFIGRQIQHARRDLFRGTEST